MKLVTIGIDGGDDSILSDFKMPFYSDLKKRSVNPRLKIDRYSRGWAEMYTGQHATRTGAFYELPEANGSIKFTRSYCWETASKFTDVKYLWDELSKRDVKSVLMNIPTTFPAPKANNITFVAGAGGGLNNLKTIPEGLCSDKTVEYDLIELDYVVDLRYKTSGIKDLRELFDSLNEMLIKRTKAFISLSKKRGADFGFLAYRATTIVQYVSMSEIELLREQRNFDTIQVQDKPRPIQKYLRNHYKVLDDCLKSIFAELSPDHYVLTADHGSVPFKYRVNINHFLRINGYQGSANLVKKLKNLAYKALPTSAFQQLKSVSPSSVKTMASGYNPNITKAFGNTNVPGIYINDKERFGGPVRSEKEVKKLVGEICAKINTDQESIKHGIQARPYRSVIGQCPSFHLLPDIWLDMPEEYFPESANQYVEVNESYAQVNDLGEVCTDVNSGQKGSEPLFMIDPVTAAKLGDVSGQDLTTVYHAVLLHF